MEKSIGLNSNSLSKAFGLNLSDGSFDLNQLVEKAISKNIKFEELGSIIPSLNKDSSSHSLKKLTEKLDSINHFSSTPMNLIDKEKVESLFTACQSLKKKANKLPGKQDKSGESFYFQTESSSNFIKRLCSNNFEIECIKRSLNDFELDLKLTKSDYDEEMVAVVGIFTEFVNSNKKNKNFVDELAPILEKINEKLLKANGMTGNEFDNLYFIQKGAQAHLYKLYDKATKKHYAERWIKIGLIEEQMHSITEILIMLKLISIENPELLIVFKIYFDNGFLKILMEFGIGDLSSFLMFAKEMELKICDEIYYGLLAQYKLLSKFNVFHRDIKPANVIITEKFKVKFVDFGFSVIERHHDKENYYQICGTPGFWHPDIQKAMDERQFKVKINLKKADEFSLIKIRSMLLNKHSSKASKPLKDLCKDFQVFELKQIHEQKLVPMYNHKKFYSKTTSFETAKNYYKEKIKNSEFNKIYPELEKNCYALIDSMKKNDLNSYFPLIKKLLDQIQTIEKFLKFDAEDLKMLELCKDCPQVRNYTIAELSQIFDPKQESSNINFIKKAIFKEIFLLLGLTENLTIFAILWLDIIL